VPVFCPPYERSPLYRPRARRLTVGPGDDWVAAIEDAPSNSEVLLLDGEYRLSQYAVRFDQPDVTLRSASGNRDGVVIRGMGYGPRSEALMLMAPNISLADLTMTQVRNHAVSIKGEYGAHGSHVYNVHLYDIGTQHIKGTPGGLTRGVVACSAIGYTPGGVRGDYINGVDILEPIDWHIRDNLFYNIRGDGSGCEVDEDCGRYGAGGGPSILMWRGGGGTLVERNVFLDCFRHIALGLGTPHGGGVIRNNFMYQSRPGDAGIELRGANDVRVYHNTVMLAGSYRGAVEVSDGGGHLIRNNLITAPVWDRGNAQFTAEGNITNARPDDLIVPQDPHLRPGSRAIGAGVALPEVDSDIDGDPRVGRWDVGADQVTSP
jgi:hypothetical protein